MGCVAQQADLARIQKDLELQISQLKSEKQALGQQVDEARLAIAESQKLIEAQKADMRRMRSDLAPLNQQLKLLREQDLTKLHGNFEVADKKIRDLRKDFSASESTHQTELASIHADIDAIQSSLGTQKTQLESAQSQTNSVTQALAQQIDANNLALNEKMTEFQQAFEQFKVTLTELGGTIQQESQRAATAETDLSNAFTKNFQNLEMVMATQQEELGTLQQLLATQQQQLDTQGQELTTHQQELSTHQQELGQLTARSQELSQSILKIGETLEHSTTALGTQLDEHTTDLLSLHDQTTALQEKLTADTQALRTYLEQDVKTAMTQLLSDIEARQRPMVARMDSQKSDIDALGTHIQANATQMQDLSQSVVKLREAQDVMGNLLGKRGDEIIQQAGRISERMNALETHQTELTQQLQINTRKTSDHLTKVTSNLTSLSQALDSSKQVLSGRLLEQENSLATLSQSLQGYQQLTDTIQTQVDQLEANNQFADQLRVSIEQINGRLQDLEIHQSGLVGKLDSDAQATNTHMREVNIGIKSVADALETVSAKLNARVDAQEKNLNQAITTFQTVQNTADISQSNLQHLNQLTETLDQLRQIVNTIGTKLGERVDQHEDRLGQLANRVNQLQAKKTNQ